MTQTAGPLVASVTAALLLAFSLSGCAAAAPAPRETYGGVPGYLRDISAAAGDRVLTGSAARPALTVEGDAVDVRLAGGTARATIVGPQVPGEGLPHQTTSTACTWTVTLTGVSGTVPVAASDFTSLDHFGSVYRPTVLAGSVVAGSVGAGSVVGAAGAAAGDTLPSAVGPGQTVTFQLRAIMRVGEGLMRWAPGGAKVASWDFQVETD